MCYDPQVRDGDDEDDGKETVQGPYISYMKKEGKLIFCPFSSSSLHQQRDAPDFLSLTSENVALVVDGPAMVHILGVPDYEKMFLRLSSICGSVVACRVSPAQKREIVR